MSDNSWAHLKNNNIALRFACFNNNLDAAKALLDREMQLHISGSSRDPLTDACILGYFAMARLFLDRGADPCSSSGQYTALGFAAERGYYDICSLLLSKGANLLAPHKGKTVLTQYACDNRNSLSSEEIQQQIDSLMDAWLNGPHPSQVQRRANQ